MRSKDVELAEKLGEKSKEYYSLCNFDQIESRDFAQKSKFHGQIMEDGYVFNPYIHRRWLPARYKQLCRAAKARGMNIEEAIKQGYGYEYSVRLSLDELQKLEMLRKTDKEAFDERKRFFTVDVIKNVLLQNLNNILIYASNSNNGRGYLDYGGTRRYNIYGYDSTIDECEVEQVLAQDWRGNYIIKETIYPTGFLNKLQKRIELLGNADTYYEISKAIKGINMKLAVRKLWYTNKLDVGVNKKFLEAFHMAGAYYTLKNDIMFSGKNVKGLRGAEACAYIKEMLYNNAKAENFDELL